LIPITRTRFTTGTCKASNP